MYKQTLAKKPRCFLSISNMLISMLLLGGCDNASNPFPASQTKQAIIPKTEIINISQGQLSVPPPLGFCKDQNSSKSDSVSTFILFANCGYLSSYNTVYKNELSFSGVVTTNVAMQAALQGDSDINEISEFLNSREGLELLSSIGKANNVSIVDKRQSPEGVYVQLHDKSAPLSQNVWKSFLKRSNHLVTVTLLQNKDARLSDEQTMQYLQSYSDTIKVNVNTPNPLPNAQHISTERIKTEENQVSQAHQLKKVGILRRLLL